MNDPYAVIKTVVLSEKSNSLTEEQNKYTFKVDKAATKIDIARAVKAIWGVAPKSVNTVNYQGKKKRQRTKFAGRAASFKKAIVTLKPDDSIEIY
ncbi:MAG: 50S ribosomal protein L23 [Lentisphaerales bacterium]|nr:50S ribosomal protein L23 [Lentisphaerales bacterium]